MTTTLVLALPNFDLPFVVEHDASDSRIGVVLLQDNKLVAHFNKTMAIRHQHLPACKKALIWFVKAI